MNSESHTLSDRWISKASFEGILNPPDVKDLAFFSVRMIL